MYDEAKRKRLRDIRTIARLLRYEPLPDLVGQRLILPSLDSVLDVVNAWLADRYAGCTNTNSNALAPLAKYGILDLEFRAPQELLPSPRAGVSALRALGFFDEAEGEGWDELFGGQEVSFFESFADKLQQGECLLKLFLYADEPTPQLKDRMHAFKDPSKIRFPREMVVQDACLTNAGEVWILKHFYL